MKFNNSLWLISDTHFGHRNIVKFQQRPESHDIIMLSEWARLVRPNDYILHLGDFALGSQGSRNRFLDIVACLPGKKYIILGNHDKESDSWDKAFDVITPQIWKVGNKVHVFTHKPINTALFGGYKWDVNIHGHIHGNGYKSDPGFSFVPGRVYINMSVEATEFKPVQLGSALTRKDLITTF